MTDKIDVGKIIQERLQTFYVFEKISAIIAFILFVIGFIIGVILNNYNGLIVFTLSAFMSGISISISFCRKTFIRELKEYGVVFKE